MNSLDRSMLLTLIICGVVASSFSSLSRADVDPRAFGEVWQSQGTPAGNQAQVVYYRTPAVSGKDAAMVYIDGEFQAALLPGMYTRFCVAQGSHTLGAYQKDAPFYKGKSEPGFSATLKGGKTYFVQVDGEVNGRPLAVKRMDAEQQLSTLRLQKHALSRASAVEACNYDQKPSVDYTLGSDVLFSFAKAGVQDMQPAGRKAIEALVARLKQNNEQNNRIEIIGHTDAIGNSQRNQKLGAARAESVKQLMMQMGISGDKLTTRSMGSSQPVVQCRPTPGKSNIACNAPNRRVVVRVETSQ